MTASAADVSLLDATAQAQLVRRGEISAGELVAWAIEGIERLNPELNAVVTTMYDEALAGIADPAADPAGGPFAGVPFLVKDLIAEVAGVPCTQGSRFLTGYLPAADSELVTRYRSAGLVLLGKTNTPEFGMVPATEPALFGATANPWDLGRSTSGSSGGSAAAVAAGLVPMAHGNDFGGSLRFPASACGIFGLKPTRGRNPLAPAYGDMFGGLVSEHAMTRSVRDSAALLDATARPALGDPYPAPPQARSFAAEVRTDPGRLRIAFTPRTPDGTPGHRDCVAALDDAVRLLDSLGHDLVEADLPGLGWEVGGAVGTVFNAAVAWMVAHWSRVLGRSPGPDDLEPVTRVFLEAGRQTSAADYLLALQDLQAFARTVARFLTSYDCWLTPTMATPPAPLGTIVSTPEQPYLALERGAPTVAYPALVANVTGNPAMSLPLWWNGEGLPVGVHVLGRYGDEATLFRLAGQLEAARPWAGRLPPVHASR
jgi:amidase